MKSLSARFEPRRARIELVPMIDTMVFLLVFFMIASLAMTKQKGMTVALPAAETASKATWADRAVVLTADTKGDFYIDKSQVSRSELGAQLSALLKSKPNSVVVINADASLLHREVVWMMDEARKAGAVQMAIATNGADDLENVEPLKN
jgi:biopolymer transport protein ExbD